MAAARRLALIAGVLYLVTFVTSIPALMLKAQLPNDPHLVLGSGAHGGVLWAGFLEVFLALTCIGTAVLFPVARRHSEPAALGFLGARVLEAAVIVVGVLSLLSVVTLGQDLAAAAGADAAALAATGTALVAIHDWAFLLGPGLIPAINALCLGYVLYRSGLLPRVIPALGLIGAPLLAGSATATLFGIYVRYPCSLRPPRCRSPCGSCRWASGWPPRGSAPRPWQGSARHRRPDRGRRPAGHTTRRPLGRHMIRCAATQTYASSPIPQGCSSRPDRCRARCL